MLMHRQYYRITEVQFVRGVFFVCIWFFKYTSCGRREQERETKVATVLPQLRTAFQLPSLRLLLVESLLTLSCCKAATTALSGATL